MIKESELLSKQEFMLCSNCQAKAIIKNGHSYYGKQRFKCNDCGRQFVEAI